MLARLKDVLLVFLLLALFLAGCAVILELSFRILGVSRGLDKQNYYSSLASWEADNVKHVSSPMDDFQIAHPLFGHAGNPRLDTNNYGFRSDMSYPPQRRSTKDILVGVFGSSMARQAAEAIGSELGKSTQLAQARACGYTFTAVNFADRGMKQPQQLQVFLHFLDSFDLSVNLDGHEDATSDPGRNFPVEFSPRTSQLYFLDPARLDRLNRILRIRKWQALLVKAGQHSILGKSDFYFAAFRTWNGMLEAKRLALLEELEQLSPPIIQNQSWQLRSTELVAAWEKYVRIQHLVARQKGKPDFFFIQPSQYNKGAKILSEEELHNAFPRAYAKRVAYFEAHEKLERAALGLRKEGFPVELLRDVFSGVKESVYRDADSQLYPEGKRVLAGKVVELITPTLKKMAPCR